MLTLIMKKSYLLFLIILSQMVLKEEPYYYPEERSVGNLKLAIYSFFSESFGIDYEKDYKYLAQVSLSQENKANLKEVIKAAKLSYEKEVIKREPELEKILWEIPESIKYNQSYHKREVKKSIMDPFYERVEASHLEKDFVEYLDTSKKVEWWFKNGEKEALFFAIPYTKNNKERLFYVDFLVKFYDGRLGFFGHQGYCWTWRCSRIRRKSKKSKRILKFKRREIFWGNSN